MITKKEAETIKIEIALLKKSTVDTLTAIQGQADSQKDLLSGINELTLEIREDRIKREAHDEKREIQDEYIQKQITSNTNRLDYFTKNYKQPIEKLKISQGRWDKLIDAIFSKAGTAFFILITVALLYFLGFNPKDFKL